MFTLVDLHRKVARCARKVTKEQRGTRFLVDPRANDVGFSNFFEGFGLGGGSGNAAGIGNSHTEWLGNPTTSFPFTPTRNQNTKAIVPNKKYSPTKASNNSQTSTLKSPLQLSRKISSSSSFNYVKNGINNEHDEDAEDQANCSAKEDEGVDDKNNSNKNNSNNHNSKKKSKRKRLFEDTPDPTGILSDKDNNTLRDLVSMKDMLKKYEEEFSQIKEAIIQIKVDQENQSRNNIISGNDMENSVEEYSDTWRRETNHQENGGSSTTNYNTTNTITTRNGTDHNSNQHQQRLTIRNNRYHPFNVAKRVHMIEQTLQRASLKVTMTETRVSRLEVKYANISRKYHAWNKLLKEGSNTRDTTKKAFFANAAQNVKENITSMCVGFWLGTASIYVARQVWLYLL
ncbi:11643_t:CDS:2 [Ambispora gerdemannii]|uniref:11643_t:CDS:1 n=1 Tax=Ambispora gerdemannii TaxID=144530 RepID=A0A9N9FUZ1_9GLOM|nr:11643_t:CDS:2 [Ambispora gerdemannii]